MCMQNLFNPSNDTTKSLNLLERPRKKEETKPKASKPKYRSLEVDGSVRYDVLSEITIDSSGMSFGQLWQGDAATLRRELDQIFGKSKSESWKSIGTVLMGRRRNVSGSTFSAGRWGGRLYTDEFRSVSECFVPSYIQEAVAAGRIDEEGNYCGDWRKVHS